MLDRKLKNFLSFFLSLILVFFVITWWTIKKFEAPSKSQSDGTFIVYPGEGFRTIAQKLKDQNFIDNVYVFQFGAIAKKSHKKLKYGEYEFPKQASMNDVLTTIIEGNTKVYKIVIPEGFSNYQIAERLRSEKKLNGKITKLLMEGSYAPETYLFSRGDLRDDLLKLMSEKQTAILEEAWQNRSLDLPIKTKEEALILASIIEKEASLGEERGIIASVFINRLNKNMRLQTDPTVIFGITQGEYKLGRGLLVGELKQFTPWNTYKIKGLPPTPITNPGKAAINAATQPADTDFLYFVANGDRGHWFAKTNDEHNKNVKKWREIENNRRKESNK